MDASERDSNASWVVLEGEEDSFIRTNGSESGSDSLSSSNISQSFEKIYLSSSLVFSVEHNDIVKPIEEGKNLNTENPQNNEENAANELKVDKEICTIQEAATVEPTLDELATVDMNQEDQKVNNDSSVFSQFSILDNDNSQFSLLDQTDKKLNESKGFHLSLDVERNSKTVHLSLKNNANNIVCHKFPIHASKPDTIKVLVARKDIKIPLKRGNDILYEQTFVSDEKPKSRLSQEDATHKRSAAKPVVTESIAAPRIVLCTPSSLRGKSNKKPKSKPRKITFCEYLAADKSVIPTFIIISIIVILTYCYLYGL